MDLLPEAKFKHGPICCTPEVKESLKNDAFKRFFIRSLSKYLIGNWGSDISIDEWSRNNRAIRMGERIMAYYRDTSVTRKKPFPTLVIMTEPRGTKTIISFSEVY